jgi:hypothetical protein
MQINFILTRQCGKLTTEGRKFLKSQGLGTTRKDLLSTPKHCKWKLCPVNPPVGGEEESGQWISKKTD